MAQSVIMYCHSQHGTVIHHVVSNSTWHTQNVSSCSVKLNMAQYVIMSCHTQHGIVCHHVVPNSTCNTLSSCSVKFKWHSVSTHHVVSNSTWYTYSLSSCSVKLNMAQSVIMSCQTQHGTVCHHVLSDST